MTALKTAEQALWRCLTSACWQGVILIHARDQHKQEMCGEICLESLRTNVKVPSKWSQAVPQKPKAPQMPTCSPSQCHLSHCALQQQPRVPQGSFDRGGTWAPAACGTAPQGRSQNPDTSFKAQHERTPCHQLEERESRQLALNTYAEVNITIFNCKNKTSSSQLYMTK